MQIDQIARKIGKMFENMTAGDMVVFIQVFDMELTE